MRVCMLAATIFLAALAGCEKSKVTVSGTVTHKGKKVVSGGVTLVASDGLTYSSQITPEGTYSIPGVPQGAVKFAVTSPNPAGTGRGGGGGGGKPGNGGLNEAGGGGPAPATTGWFALPDKYGDLAQSGLSTTVSGDTKHDIDLP